MALKLVLFRWLVIFELHKTNYNSYFHKVITLGQGAVTVLAQSCGYNNPVDFVVKNSDYLSHHFTTRLWSLSENLEVLNALKVVMNLNGSDDLLQSFHSIVTDVSQKSYK